mgnify:CR=1 FL=1
MSESKKSKHKEYLDAMSRVKPSAEVKFRSNNGTTITERSATREYWEGMTSDAVQDVSDEYKEVHEEAPYVENPDKNKHPGFRDVLSRMENKGKTLEQLSESLEDSMLDATDGSASPLSQPVNDWANQIEVPLRTIEMMIQSIEKLVQRVDKMEKSPIIHVPAPVINITMPDITRTVTKVIERGPDGYIKEIKETVEETPHSEPLIEINDEDI